MVSVPIGQSAYKRLAGGEPEVRLENRFLEKSPTNLREKVTLIGRPGSNSLAQCAGGSDRGNFAKAGFLNGDLFKSSGHNLWRVPSTQVPQQITGVLAGDGYVYATWMKGIGYENLFVSDGSTLWYFSEHASGILTLTGNIQSGMIIRIGSLYYGWNADVDFNSPAGTLANPYWAALASDGASTDDNNTQSLANMVLLINFAGIPGSDFSTAVTGPDPNVTATSNQNYSMTVTAIDNTAAGNSIVTTAPDDGGASIAWGSGTLTGGGGTALQQVTGMGPGEVPKALATVSGYVLVSVGNSQKFYWINPGETIINPLNFAEKESNPDNILDMLTVGDQVLICGDGSAENWYASGNFDAPFVPVEGRVYARGVIEGTPVVVNDGVALVGNDGVVYLIGGYAFGQSYGGEVSLGVKRISDNAIEERIRICLRAEQSLPP
jgi:hypothetical protein